VEIPSPVADTTISYNLVWMPASLRQPRVAFAKNSLLERIRQNEPEIELKHP